VQCEPEPEPAAPSAPAAELQEAGVQCDLVLQEGAGQQQGQQQQQQQQQGQYGVPQYADPAAMEGDPMSPGSITSYMRPVSGGRQCAG
jgi:hypothetical protein